MERLDSLSIFYKKLYNLEFPEFSKKNFDIDAVEYVNQFFKNAKKEYLKELKSRTDDLGVNNVLIMIDAEGNLGETDDTKRQKAVENHGGYSSNGKWMSDVIRKVDKPNCGTLPDFGNFRINGTEEYDRYQGMKELMPFAKGVSAKSHVFDEEGNEKNTDFYRMLKIVKEAGYTGYIGIEYEGRELSEVEGVLATKKLLIKAGKSL